MKKDRYKDFKGYRLDRWMFQTAMWLCFAWMFIVLWLCGFDMDYYSCDGPVVTVAPDQELCTNPFYKEPTWKNREFLMPGEYGHKPGLLFQSAIFVSLGLLVLTLLFNHLVHNKKKREV